MLDQKKIADDVALPVVRPIAYRSMVPTFRAKRFLIVDQLYHDRFQAGHIEATGSLQPLPILVEGLGKIAGQGRRTLLFTLAIERSQQRLSPSKALILG